MLRRKFRDLGLKTLDGGSRRSYTTSTYLHGHRIGCQVYNHAWHALKPRSCINADTTF